MKECLHSKQQKARQALLLFIHRLPKAILAESLWLVYRINGNAMTSLIEDAFVSSMTSLHANQPIISNAI